MRERKRKRRREEGRKEGREVHGWVHGVVTCFFKAEEVDEELLLAVITEVEGQKGSFLH